MTTFIIVFLLTIIALAVGGLKVAAISLIIVGFIAIAVVSAIVGGFHKMADRGDELYERDQREQS